MKRVFPLLLALAFLSGCGTPAPAEPETLPEEPLEEMESVFLPETRQLEPISAPAIVEKGREPSEDYALPETLLQIPFSEIAFPALLTEETEADSALYAVGNETVLLRWEDSLAEFDWDYITPRMIMPRIDCFDVDGDWEDELIVICYVGSGTGVSVEELHIIGEEPGQDLTAYTLPRSLWLEQVPTLFDAAVIGGRTYAILGHELVDICDDDGLAPETACTGLIAGFESNGSLITFRGAFALCREDSTIPHYVAETSADVRYKDGAFTMQDFHLYSYCQ